LNVDGREVYFVSVYFKFSDPVNIHLQGLSNVIDALQGKPLIIGGDFNARSPLWYDRPGTDRSGSGGAVEDFITSYGLNILNGPGQPATFSGPMGDSFIDLTLCTNDMLTVISDWRVCENDVSCDHRLISWKMGGIPAVEPRHMWSFRLSNPDWDYFDTVLALNLSEMESWISQGAEVACEKFNVAVVEAATRVLGRSRPGRGRSSNWWTPELTILRRKLTKNIRKYDFNNLTVFKFLNLCPDFLQKKVKSILSLSAQFFLYMLVGRSIQGGRSRRRLRI
jgi:hypothetical protein